MHFLLWTKGSHQSLNFDTSKCSGENLPNSLCHSSNHKSVFLQILHDISVSWNILLYTLHKRDQSKCKFLRLWVLGSKFPKFLSFLKQQISFSSSFVWLFSDMRHNSSVLFLAEIRWNLTWAVGCLKFCTLMGSFSPNHIKFQLKKYRRIISHDTEEWCKV